MLLDAALFRLVHDQFIEPEDRVEGRAYLMGHMCGYRCMYCEFCAGEDHSVSGGAFRVWRDHYNDRGKYDISVPHDPD